MSTACSPETRLPETAVKGTLWYSGAVIRQAPLVGSRESSITPWQLDGLPGLPAAITLGFPVEPPDVGALRAGADTETSGLSGRSAVPSKDLSRFTDTDLSVSSNTRAGAARSIRASISRCTNMLETGIGTAPILSAAMVATGYFNGFDDAMRTKSPRPTPMDAKRRATRFVRASNSAYVSLSSEDTSAVIPPRISARFVECLLVLHCGGGLGLAHGSVPLDCNFALVCMAGINFVLFSITRWVTAARPQRRGRHMSPTRAFLICEATPSSRRTGFCPQLFPGKYGPALV